MAREIIQQVTYKVEEVCSKCKKGYMRPNPKGQLVHTNPPLIPHICTEKLCGHTDAFRQPIPAFVYENVPGAKTMEVSESSSYIETINPISKDVKKVIN